MMNKAYLNQLKNKKEKFIELVKTCNPKIALKVQNCEAIKAKQEPKERNVKKCRDRFCPVCQHNKVYKERYKFEDIQEYLVNTPDEYGFVYITLTVKNCKEKELLSTHTKLLNAFRKLAKHKYTSVIPSKSIFKKPKRIKIPLFHGYVAGVENEYKIKTDDYHPHIHAIFVVDKSYNTNSKKRLTKNEWINLWWDKLITAGIDYQVSAPEVYIRSIEDITELCRVFGYMGKETNFHEVNSSNIDISLKQNIYQVMKECLYRKHLFLWQGQFRKIRIDLKDVFEKKYKEYLN